MYQEDAEYYEHSRQLVSNEMERRKGTGMIDLKQDDWVTDISRPVHDLHAVFAVTIYGDKIRVSHYGKWEAVITAWDVVDCILKSDWNLYPLLKYVCVRSWGDPQWNTARYRSMDTVAETEV
jgi:hypothetical protein